MKKILLLSLFQCCLLTGLLAQNKTMNLMSFNIRMNTPSDGENAWPNRKQWVGDVVKFNQVEILGCQEVLVEQLHDLQKELPHMDYVGVGRADGKEGGEFSPIFYNKKEFKVLDSGTFWLSTTPDVPSTGWDAALPRVCTWIKIKHKQSKRTMIVMNTHYDHIGKEAVIESSKLIAKKAQELSDDGKVAVVLMGDLNSTPNSTALVELNHLFQDTRTLSLTNPMGPVGTWQAFDYNAALDTQIDFIMTYGYFKVLRYAHISEARDHKFPSDHLPVFVEIQ